MSQPKLQGYVSMGRSNFRRGWPEFMRQLPIVNMRRNDKFQLISKQDLDDYLAKVSPEVRQKILEDMATLEREMMPLFRDRDYLAKREQNRYRLFQILFMFLAALATLIGSFQVVALSEKPQLMPWIAFGETIVALLTTFIATIRGNQPPLQQWLLNRRRAEYLRREYFRFLADAPPYAGRSQVERRRLISRRVADINRGVDPEDVQGG